MESFKFDGSIAIFPGRNATSEGRVKLGWVEGVVYSLTVSSRMRGFEREDPAQHFSSYYNPCIRSLWVGVYCCQPTKHSDTDFLSVAYEAFVII